MKKIKNKKTIIILGCLFSILLIGGTFAYFTTTGYARTQSDANKLNSSSGKPSTLTFVVKP